MNMKTFSLLFFLSSSCFLNAGEFSSDFKNTHDRVWLGEEYWANPMEDWLVRDGRIVCMRNGANRNVHLLTHGLTADNPNGSFVVSIRLGIEEGPSKKGSAGFMVGVIDQETRDPRASLLMGKGLVAGVRTNGKLFIGKAESVEALSSVKDLILRLEATPSKTKGSHNLRIIAFEGGTEKELARLSSQKVKSETLAGNFAIGCNMDAASTAKGAGKLSRFWFSDWKVAGGVVQVRSGLAFGPILYAMHTLSRGTLNLTAQMPPLGEKEAKSVRLDAKDDSGKWKKQAVAQIDPLSRTATFRVKGWSDSRDVAYRVAFEDRKKDGSTKERYFEGMIRRDPVDKKEVVVAGFTGNKATAFPNSKLVKNVGIVNPDLLFFSGDQIYEDVGGYGIHRSPVDLAVLNYLRKIYLWGWAFRDLMRDRPTIALPDDHDVYQGNIWGAAGRDCGGMKGHSQGGYAMHQDFVNAVQRTQTAHHPAPFDSTPVKRGIGVYYGDMIYGRVGFAILEDRKFKSGPEGKVNYWKGRPDHVKDPKFKPSSVDKEGLVLLGERQLKFIRHFAGDWKGTDLKVALSQTIFCNLANYHGGGQQYIVADLDSNGWPQSGRNRALDELRKGFVFHYAGDQHLPSIVHHGIDKWGDAGFSFCVPSIAAGYPRSWRPDKEGRAVRNRSKPGLPNTGDYTDGFANKLTVHAIGNPAAKNRKGRLATLHDKASGFGIVRLNVKTGTIRMECHRLLIDAANPKPGDQFPGWPKTIRHTDNYGRKPVAHLPEIKVEGLKTPVVQVKVSKTGELVYALRLRGNSFRPPVFDKGATYEVRVGEPDRGLWKTLKSLKGESTDSQSTRTVKF
jgi:alkaline phosphatase D